jgi:hypothetical protein
LSVDVCVVCFGEDDFLKKLNSPIVNKVMVAKARPVYCIRFLNVMLFEGRRSLTDNAIGFAVGGDLRLQSPGGRCCC